MCISIVLVSYDICVSLSTRDVALRRGAHARVERKGPAAQTRASCAGAHECTRVSARAQECGRASCVRAQCARLSLARAHCTRACDVLVRSAHARVMCSCKVRARVHMLVRNAPVRARVSCARCQCVRACHVLVASAHARDMRSCAVYSRVSCARAQAHKLLILL